jgi:hypothetical protein
LKTKVANKGWSLVIGHWSLVISYWSLITGNERFPRDAVIFFSIAFGEGCLIGDGALNGTIWEGVVFDGEVKGLEACGAQIDKKTHLNHNGSRMESFVGCFNNGNNNYCKKPT